MEILLVVITVFLVFIAIKLKTLTDNVGKLIAVQNLDREQQTTLYPVFTRNRLNQLFSEASSAQKKYHEYGEKVDQLFEEEREAAKVANIKHFPSDTLQRTTRTLIETALESEDARLAYLGAIEANIKVLNGSLIEQVAAEYEKQYGFSAEIRSVKQAEIRYKEWLESFN